MRKFIISLTILLVGLVVEAAPKTLKVKLSSTNTVVLRGPVTSGTVAPVQTRLLELSQTLPKNATIYLFLDTPGGSVTYGMEMINTAKSIPQKVSTITNFAASMGFITVQYLGPRIILPSGVLMSHRAYGGVEGQIPGEMNSRVDFITKSIQDIELQCAKRMKLKHTTYSKMIVNEYWTEGRRAVSQNAADFIGDVTCDSSLQGTERITLNTMFGPVRVKYSKCPLITSPLDVSFSATQDYLLSNSERLQFRNYITSLLTDKSEFVKKSLDSKRNLQFRYLQ